jgi:hypothetical protein
MEEKNEGRHDITRQAPPQPTTEILPHTRTQPFSNLSSKTLESRTTTLSSLFYSSSAAEIYAACPCSEGQRVQGTEVLDVDFVGRRRPMSNGISSILLGIERRDRGLDPEPHAALMPSFDVYQLPAPNEN